MRCSYHNAFSSAALDHAQKQRNYGRLKEFRGHPQITGLCGDKIDFWLYVMNGVVNAASVITDGCCPSLYE